MKKLMTMIAAVAMSFGLFADGVSLNAAFDASQLDKGPYAPTAPGWAAYSGAAGTLNIVNDDEPRVLEIKTGTAELARNVATDGNAWEITNLYLEASIDFQDQALEDVPTNISDTDKIALFILDTSDIEGAPGTTNLFAMAGYGALGKALFDLGEVDEEWYAMAKHISIKAYDNVFQGGKRTGFLVSVVSEGDDFAVESVEAVYPITVDPETGAEVIDWTDRKGSDYLNLGEDIRLVSKVSKWAKNEAFKRNLLFSMATSQSDNGSLTSVGFTGNAQIASVGFTETDPGFGSDSVGMNLSVTEGVTFTLTPESIAAGFEANGTSITGPASGDPFTFTVDKGSFDNVTVTLVTKIDPDDQGVYAAELTPSSTLTVEGWDTVAWVGNTPFKSLFGDDPDTCAIAHVNANGGTLKLATDVTAGTKDDISFEGDKDIILDLAGKTLTVADDKSLSNTGKLTIMDSLTGGNIVGDVENFNTLVISNGVFNGDLMNTWDEGLNGVTTIYGGTFEGAVENDPVGADDETAVKIIAVGGKFLQEDDQQQPVNTKEAVEEFLPAPGEKTYEVVDDENGYWQVVEVTAYTITVDPTIEHGAVTTDPADKAEVGETVTVIADPADDYKLGAITVEQEDGTPVDVGEDGTFEMPAANVTVSATFIAIDYVAQIGDNKYETFEAAVAALTADDQTIKLIKDAALTAGVTPAFNTTFDLGGFTLDAGTIRSNIVIQAGKMLSITNGTFTHTAPDYSIEVWGTLNVQDGARVTKAKSAGAPVFDVYPNSTINVYAGSYVDNGGSQQVFRFKEDNAANATVNVYGGEIKGNGSKVFDLYKKDSTATVTIAGGQIETDSVLIRTGKSDKPDDESTFNLTITDGQIKAKDNFIVEGAGELKLTLDNTCKAKFSSDQGLNDYCADGYKAFKAEGSDWYTIVATQLYVANLYVGGQAAGTIELGTDGQKFAKGEKVVATKPGVIDDTVEPDFAQGKTYYVEKLVLFGDTEGDNQVCEFTYDGTTLAKKGDDGIGVDLQGNILTYTVTTGDKNPFGAVYVKEYVASQPVNPGEEKKYNTTEEATAAAKNINDHKDTMINVPTEASGDKAAYLARVAAKVEADGLTVVVDIAADKEATFKAELDTEIKKTTVAAALTDASVTEVTITTVAGFYYWVEGGVEVGTIKTNGQAVIGDGSTIKLTKPALGTTTKAFYKLAVGVKDPADTPIE